MSALDEIMRARGIQLGGPATKAAAVPAARIRGAGEPQKAADTGAPIIYHCVQGTTEWHELRAGKPTASCFEKIITAGGKPSRQAEAYKFRLCAELLMGHSIEEKPFSHWQDRGSQMEAEARSYYEFQRDMETEKVGFVENAAGTIGASPDSLVDAAGLLEIKCPSEAVHMSYLLQTGSAYAQYRVQVQGQLWVTQREWSDVLSYHPELPKALMRIERDESFIAEMAPAVERFAEELAELFTQCVERGYVREKRERPAPKREPLPPLTDLVKSALRDMAGRKAGDL